MIVGVQATAARMSQETVAAQDMIARFAAWQGRDPESVVADATYGNGEFLQWLMEREITPSLSASTRPGPLCDFYVALVEKGMRPTMARLTLARKMAAITLTIWKKGVEFDAKPLNRQAA